MLDKNIAYSEYIAENLDKNIAYAEYIAGHIGRDLAKEQRELRGSEMYVKVIPTDKNANFSIFAYQV